MSYTLNRTGAELDTQGTVVSQNSSLTSIENDTETNLVSITLTKGVWVVVGQLRMQGGGLNYQASLSISTRSGISDTTWGGYDQFPVTNDMGNISTTTTKIITVTASSQTIYLVGWQRSGTQKGITQGGTNLRAVRIK